MARPPFKFACRGLNLARPIDQLPEGFYPVLKNVRVTAQGELDVRQGLELDTQIGVNPLHSIRRLNNGVDSTFTRISGTAGDLYSGNQKIDTGYSGKPLSLLPFRPNRSPNPFMYVGDGYRTRKVKVDGTNYQVGIDPPASSPSVSLQIPNYEFIANFESQVGANSGSAGLVSGASRINTTIAAIVYDLGANGWCSIVPATAGDNIQPGCGIAVNGVESTKITEVHQPIANTTVAAIIYDAGNTGSCAIVLTDVSPNLQSNSIIKIGAEYVRVRHVIDRQDGSGSSIRATTTATHAVGETVTGYISFRCYLGGSFAPGQTIIENVITWSTATGTGTITINAVPNPRALDVITPDGEGGRPATLDDYVHLSIKVDNPANVTSFKIIIDISDGSFGVDYLYYSVPIVQLNPNGWTEVLFKLSEMVRVGGDQTKSLHTVAAYGVVLTVTAATQTSIGAWWIGGTYGLDVTTSDAPIQWAYRYRDSRTGAKSNPSPYTRTGLYPQRDAALIAVLASADPQVNTIDILRFGGGLNVWVVVGSYPNANQTVVDQLSTLAVQANEVGVQDDYRPFPVSDLPHAGTCNVAGTTVQWVSGDKFDTRWVPGSIITINGVACTLYGSPSSPTLLQIVQSVQAANAVPFSLPEPTLAGYPLPAIWMFGGQGIGTFMFGVGDPFNPGFLRWCKGNDPDAASDTGNLEITSPSEPLMNGCEYDSRAFVFSTERLFALFPNFGTVNVGGVGETLSSSSGNQFTAQPVVSNAGLFSRFGFCVTPYGIAWIARDGIYLWSGGAPKSLTDATIYPLFPHGGVAAESVNGYNPPDYTQPNELRLSFADNSLFFTYIDTKGVRCCLRFDFTETVMGWFPYSYYQNPTVYYMEEGEEVNSVLMGGADGNLYKLSPKDTDNFYPISCHVRTPSLDLGDSRVLKYFMDSILDHTGTFNYILGYNNYSILQAQAQVSQATRGQSIISIALNDGDELNLYRNIALDLTWNGAGTLYEFQPNAIPQPMLTNGLVTQYTDNGYPGFTHAKEAWMAVISSADVTLDIYIDGTRYSFTIPNTNGRLVKQKLLLGPLKGKMFLYRVTSAKPFIPFADDMVILMKPWGQDGAFNPVKVFAGVAA